MDGDAVALGMTHGVDVLPGHTHLAAAGLVAAGDQLEERGLAQPVGAHHANDTGLMDLKVRFQREGHLRPEEAAGVLFLQPVDVQQWRGCHGQTPSKRVRSALSLSKAAAGPSCTTQPRSST